MEMGQLDQHTKTASHSKEARREQSNSCHLSCNTATSTFLATNTTQSHSARTRDLPPPAPHRVLLTHRPLATEMKPLQTHCDDLSTASKKFKTARQAYTEFADEAARLEQDAD